MPDDLRIFRRELLARPSPGLRVQVRHRHDEVIPAPNLAPCFAFLNLNRLDGHAALREIQDAPRYGCCTVSRCVSADRGIKVENRAAVNHNRR